MNSMDEKLWNYIDGTCTPQEHEAINRLIEQDEVYRHKYNELLALNAEFSNNIELDEPPMAFTFNVMEQIRAEQALKPLKATIDQRVIKGIAAFFILTISAIMLYVLFSVNWSAGGIDWKMPEFKIPQIQISGLLNSGVMKAFLFFDAILCLYLFDYFLRRKRTAKTA
ncbi:hypothetical protein LT679_08500 [Mucilaginibacter roseus]|uniref:Zf-HC2 domain-containing protein n=1 Tax=Mucilaginibacter roseus TaxID=1528868 RepID=A0ABS8U0K4_9SPHI|nr:hypothetical protein [Mucilaginibacter roseus]MCD8740636.1 hypothetical protein [Mucilaginibacter roseus]